MKLATLLAILLCSTVASAQTARDARYIGSFRLPQEGAPATPQANAYPPEYRTVDYFDFGGKPFVLDGQGNLIVGTRRSRLALVSIPPTPVPFTRSASNLPTASRLSNFVDATNNTWNLTSDDQLWDGKGLSGALPFGPDKIIVTGQTYYDANNMQRRGHLVASWPPNGTSVQQLTPWRTVGSNTQQGLIAGYMVTVPQQWQAALKGRVCTGQAGLPIITRGSAGPALFCFEPDQLLSQQNIAATMVVGYPGGHHTLGRWEDSSAMYGMTTEITGVTFIDDYAVFVGNNGTGEACYGSGTSDPSKHHTTLPDGDHLCYDPVSSSKGNHSYPYRAQAWAYPLADLAEVAAGRREPWSLIPTFWPLPLPLSKEMNRIGGTAFDPATRRWYISHMGADALEFSVYPMVHVFEVPAIQTPVPPAPTPDVAAQVNALQEEVAKLKKLLQDILAVLASALKQ